MTNLDDSIPDVRLRSWIPALAGPTGILLAGSLPFSDEIPPWLAQPIYWLCAVLGLCVAVLLTSRQRLVFEEAGEEIVVERRLLGILWRKERVPRNEILEVWPAWATRARRPYSFESYEPVSIVRRDAAPLLVGLSESATAAQEIGGELARWAGCPLQTAKPRSAVPGVERKRAYWNPDTVGTVLLVVSALLLLAHILFSNWRVFFVIVAMALLSAGYSWFRERRRAKKT